MLVRGSCVTVPASLDLERHCINQEQEGRCRYEGTLAHKKIGGPAQKRDEAPWDAGGRQQQSSAATADAMGFWVIGGDRRVYKMCEDRLLSFLCPALSVLPWVVSHTPPDCCC